MIDIKKRQGEIKEQYQDKIKQREEAVATITQLNVDIAELNGQYLMLEELEKENNNKK